MNNNKLNKILTITILILVAVILAGTIFGIIKNITTTPEKLISEGKAENLLPPEETADTAYFELGTMRLSPEQEDSQKSEPDSISPMGTVMIITPCTSRIVIWGFSHGEEFRHEDKVRNTPIIKKSH